jgi:hypothetical protein
VGKSKKDDDTIRVSVNVDVEVSEKAWREMCARKGINLEGVIVAAHVGKSVKAAAYRTFADLGFPQS